MDSILVQFAKLFPEIHTALNAGIMIFARMLGLFMLTPVFSRKEIPVMVKISFAIIMTVISCMVIKPGTPPPHLPIILCIMLNFLFGALLGFASRCILEAVAAGGDMINSQMGLSSASTLDPSTQQQTTVLTTYFSFLGMIIFISIGGFYWVLNAFLKSFTVFPMYSTKFNLEAVANFKYITTITSNVLFMGMQIASPVLLATLGQDIILGIISKTAPQVNVFSLSFLAKPCLGAAILVWILPALVSVISDYMNSYAGIF